METNGKREIRVCGQSQPPGEHLLEHMKGPSLWETDLQVATSLGHHLLSS